MVQVVDSQTVKLLASCRAYFTQHPVDRVLSKDLLAFLNAQEEEPWNTFNRGDGMNGRQLADRLKPYGIASRTLRGETERAKGYYAEDFADAFTRYLPAYPSHPLPPP